MFIWEDINNILYSKDNKFRRMVKYYILKMYSKQFESEKEFVKFNLEQKKIPMSSKYGDIKLEIVKHQYDFNLLFTLLYLCLYHQHHLFSQDMV
jgi:hypothetical protein